jgi:hypothetical protein
MALKIKCMVNAVVGVLVVSATALANASDLRPKVVSDYEMPGVGYLNIAVVDDVLGLAELERRACIVKASEAQLHFIRAMYDDFVRRHNELMDREASVHVALAAGLSAQWKLTGSGSSELVESAKTLERHGIRLRRQLEMLEQELITTIEPILALEQAAFVEAARQRAARRQHRIFPLVVRWADVDLRDVWEDAALPLAGPEDIEAAEAILAGYDQGLTALLRRYTDAKIDFRMQTRDSRLYLSQSATSYADHRAIFERLAARKLDAGRRIRALNEQTLGSMVDQISDEAGAALLARARATAFPELYPDPTALHGLVGGLLDDRGVPMEQKSDLTALFQTYVQAYRRACEELEAMCVEWGDRTEGGETGYEPQLLPQTIKPLLDERDAISRRWLEKMRVVVGADLVD